MENAKRSKLVRKVRTGASSVAAPAVSGPSPRLYARAFEILAGRIADGSLPAGTRLLESHVAADFGISRAPARQALNRLLDEGLVVRADGHGFIVRGSAQPGETGTAPQRPIEPLRLTSAATWQRIYSEVESAIAARTAVGSWRVIESELASFYGVSRTVARDVVARLHLRGVIKRDDKARWYAPALTPQYVGELYEMRWLLEPAALLSALETAPPGLLTTIRQHLEEALTHAEDLEGPALDALEDELHTQLLGYCRKSTLMDALRLYQSLLIAHSFLYSRAAHLFPVEPFLPEHLEIIERAEAGHAADAARALEKHLRASRDRAIARIGAVVKEFRPEPLPYLAPLKSAD
jgi:DNA-binding GntR family transcriptional regulator